MRNVQLDFYRKLLSFINFAKQLVLVEKNQSKLVLDIRISCWKNYIEEIQEEAKPQNLNVHLNFKIVHNFL